MKIAIDYIVKEMGNKKMKTKLIIETAKPTSASDVPRLSLPNYGPASGKKQH